MMKRTSVLDFLGVVRIVGYSLAIVPALIAVVLYLIGHWWPLAGFIVAPFLGPVIAGLLVAWIAWLSRMLVRRMPFASRSEERRVGKEGDRPCRSRGSPDH